jgi:hypothetical protein
MTRNGKMATSKGIKFYGIALVVYGVYNLLGTVNRGQFALMFEGLPPLLVTSLYVFTAFYSICCAYCGLKILKLEDWARRLITVLTAISVLLGILLNKLVMANFRVFLASEGSGLTPDMVEPVFRYMVALTFVFTLFELSLIYFFTRPRVTAQFTN